MRMINLDIPRKEGDDRFTSFTSNLKKELAARGNISPAQARFFSACRKIPVLHDGKEAEIEVDNLLVLVYEPGLASMVTAALRKALERTWPNEHSRFQIYEIDTGKKPSLWSIRGGKQ